jgi:hypothetical protein
MVFNDDIHRRFENIYIDYLRKIIPSIFEKFDDVNNEEAFKNYTFKRINMDYIYHAMNIYDRPIVSLCFETFKWLYQTPFDSDEIFSKGDFNFYRDDLKNFGKNKDYHIHEGITKEFMERFIRMAHNLNRNDKYEPSKYISTIGINDKKHYMFHVSDTPFSNEDKFWFNRDNDNFAFCFVLYLIEMYGTSGINFNDDIVFAELKPNVPSTMIVKYNGSHPADMQRHAKILTETISGFDPKIHRILVVKAGNVDIIEYGQDVVVHLNYDNLKLN